MRNGLDQWGHALPFLRQWEVGRGPAPAEDTGRDTVRSGFAPCLVTLLRLSAPPRFGADVDSLPPWLLAGLARTGHLPLAAELALSTGDELGRAERLLAVVRAAADAGDVHGAQALTDSITLRQCRDQALVGQVSAWARAGERDRAVALAETVRYPHHWAVTWALLAKAVADGGDTRAALAFADRAEEHVFCGDPSAAKVLVLLLEVADLVGDRDRADDLADRLEDWARSRGRRDGGFDRDRPRPLATVLVRDLHRGDLDRLDALLRRPRRSPLDAWVMAVVLASAPASTDVETALALADRAQTLLGACATSSGEAIALCTAAARMLALHGQVERAAAFADAMHAPDVREERQTQIVAELARGGDTGRAEELARAIGDGATRGHALVAVVRELARQGETDRAARLADTIDDPWLRDHALVAVVPETARHGQRDRAEALARTIVHRATRARALTELAEVLTESSEPSEARRLAVRAAALDGWSKVLPLLERLAPDALVATVDAWTGGRVGEPAGRADGRHQEGARAPAQADGADR